MTYLVYNKSKLTQGNATLCWKGHLHFGASINDTYTMLSVLTSHNSNPWAHIICTCPHVMAEEECLLSGRRWRRVTRKREGSDVTDGTSNPLFRASAARITCYWRTSRPRHSIKFLGYRWFRREYYCSTDYGNRPRGVSIFKSNSQAGPCR